MSAEILIAKLNKVTKVHNGGWKACCPAHDDKNPSLSVSEANGKVLVKCHAGCSGEAVMQAVGLTWKDLSDAKPAQRVEPQAQHTLVETYKYTTENGDLLYEVCRYHPKTFRQRRPDGKGGWLWNMTDVRRVPYRLPDVMKADTVAICEGEKDANAITKLGWCGTATVGGSKGWLSAYGDYFRDKEVLLFPDQDEAGKAYRDAVLESIGPIAKNVRVVNVSAGCKDVAEFIMLHGEKAKERIEALIADAPVLTKGIHVPIYTAEEAEAKYQKFLRESAARSFDLGRFLPSLGRYRPLVPGELVAVIADTGVGKTAILQNIARAARPLPVLFFELELPIELMFERAVAMANDVPAITVEKEYRSGGRAGMVGVDHIYVCDNARMSTGDIERVIVQSELKLGRRPAVVCVDYIGLLSGSGKRYERTSDAAEDLKRVAKSTGTIIILCSQVHRARDTEEIGLHDAKDSGSIEASCGMVIGAWRDPTDTTGGTMVMKVLKCTKGKAGTIITCNFEGETLRITERAMNHLTGP
jgi:5S rRNA maturation endonuclease (ribonuclease M5)